MTALLAIGGLFLPLRWLERWLHQHLFKVGWLLTKRLRATTALYYTFFLPGVLLNQVAIWLVAGLLNVRAERAIAWPEAQEAGELRLSFVQLARETGSAKLAIIHTAPLVAGVIALYLITNNILHLHRFGATWQAGGFPDPGAALHALTATPDFWLWVYIAFTIANTMMPRSHDLKGWRLTVIIVSIFIAVLFAIGVGDDLFLGTLAEPLANGLNTLAGVFATVIGIDLAMVVILGTVEAIIERVTGDNVTFRNGRMITLTREEARQLREQEQARKERQASRRASTPPGPPSVYKLPFPIPDGPSRDSAAERESIIVRREEPAPTPARPAMPGTAPGDRPALTRGGLFGATPQPERPEDRSEDAKTPPAPENDAAGDDGDEDFSEGITREPPEEPA